MARNSPLARAPADVVNADPPGRRGFLGRDAELAELRAVLERTRVLTLTGPPGIGKSRLALELTRAAAELYPDGTAVVELAAVAEEGLVPQALASALSVKEARGASLVDLMASRLKERRLLLVIDNCEHVLGACASLVSQLIDRCSKLSVIATSREPLGISSETVWRVPPLPAPDSAGPYDAELLDYASVRLFVERARAVEPDFSLNDFVAPAVAEICRGLDGIPLAIELAAARVEALTPAEIAARLGDRFDLLVNGTGRQLPRHKTLEAALDWSEGLLSEAERTLLQRLSVFAGGFDPQAAAAVCSGGDVDADEVGALLDQLVAKSLVVPLSDASRHRLLETIRVYAARQLEQAGEARAVRERHARYYTEFAEGVDPELRGPDQAAWLERLEVDHANLRAALAWSLGHGRGEWALRLSGSLVWFWTMRGHYSEGRAMLEAALSASQTASPELEAKALWGAGYLTLMAGDVERAAALLEQTVERYRSLGDRHSQSRALLVLANANHRLGQARVSELAAESAALAREVGDLSCLGLALSVAGHALVNGAEFAAARPLLEECIAVAPEAGDRDCLRRGLLFLGQVDLFQGHYGAAERQLNAALAIADELGDDYSRGTTLQYLGSLAARRGDHSHARELLDEAIALLRRVRPGDLKVALSARADLASRDGDRDLARQLIEEALEIAAEDRQDLVVPLLAMGRLEFEGGNLASARRHFDESLERSGGHGFHAAAALRGLGDLALKEGDARRAVPLFREALRLSRRCGDADGMAASLEALARLTAAADRLERTGRLFGAALGLRQRMDESRPGTAQASLGDDDLALLRKSLTRNQIDACLAEGAGAPLDDVVDEAVGGGRRRERPVAGWASLTEAEQNVAALVAEGMSNQAIADRLFRSPRTVRNHLSSIFAKLGISRRTELAKEVWRRRGGSSSTEG